MFPAETTWMLAFWFLIFSASEIIVFLWTDWNTPAFAIFDGSQKGLVAFFQAVSTRTAGLSTININDTSPPYQFMLFMWMYIAIYPMLLSYKRSRRDEHVPALNNPSVESALKIRLTDSANRLSAINQPKIDRFSTSIFSNVADRFTVDFSRFYMHDKKVVVEREQTIDTHQDFNLKSEKPMTSQIKDLICQEIPATCAAIFAIVLNESDMLRRSSNPNWMSIWGVMFEISSAYGTCGLTLSTHAVSLSGFFSTFSKLIIVVVMIAGRHRGLPRAMDPNIGIRWDKLKKIHLPPPQSAIRSEATSI
jgi:hypothetical protein